MRLLRDKVIKMLTKMEIIYLRSRKFFNQSCFCQQIQNSANKD